MASKITICNQALTMLGVGAISGFDDLSAQAIACANLWDNVRDSVLRAGAWDCAVRRLEISPLADEPLFEFGYKYALPDGCLRVLSITNDLRQADYQIEGRELLCNESTIYLRYVARVEDPALWDVGLRDVMAAAMAAELAYPLVREQAPIMRQEYMRRLQEHRAIDGQQGTIARIPSGNAVKMRSMS